MRKPRRDRSIRQVRAKIFITTLPKSADAVYEQFQALGIGGYIEHTHEYVLFHTIYQESGYKAIQGWHAGIKAKVERAGMRLEVVKADLPRRWL